MNNSQSDKLNGFVQNYLAISDGILHMTNILQMML